jgi:hypothetical protein
MEKPTEDSSQKARGDFWIGREFLEQDACMNSIVGFGDVQKDSWLGAALL